LFYSLLVLIIGTYDKNGRPDAMNAVYGGLYTSGMVEFSISHDHKTFKNIQQTHAFTISFEDAANMAACDYVGLVSGNDTPDKMEKTGWTIAKSEFVNAPFFEELPVTWECEFVRMTEEGKIDMDAFKPLVFDHTTYDYLKVDGVAGKSFEVGKKLK